MEMRSIASKALVPFLFTNLEHELDDALNAIAEADGSGTSLVEMLVATNVVAFSGNPGEVVHFFKSKKVENVDKAIVQVELGETRGSLVFEQGLLVFLRRICFFVNIRLRNHVKHS